MPAAFTMRAHFSFSPRMKAAVCSADSDSPKQLIYFVLDFLGTIDPVQGEEHRQRIEPFLGQESDWDNPDSLIDPAKSIGRSPNAIALRAEVEDLYEELLVRRPELVAGSDPARYREAVHYAI